MAHTGSCRVPLEDTSWPCRQLAHIPVSQVVFEIAKGNRVDVNPGTVFGHSHRTNQFIVLMRRKQLRFDCHQYSLALGQQLNDCSLVGCIGLQRGLMVLGKQLFVIPWSLEMASCIRCDAKAREVPVLKPQSIQGTAHWATGEAHLSACRVAPDIAKHVHL